jgi:hypothetical protein
MKYYGVLGDPKSTILMRYFMTGDEDVKSNALPEAQQVINSLVISPYIMC